ncbi:MAG: outer membrane protein assembly factor BamA [Bdellovibrionales bacterium]|nr:outer membrane protein assembly factor BamA [Bdellovibrionales bacterium]
MKFKRSALHLVSVFILLFASSISYAEKITEVKTVGLKRIERDAILEKISSKPGVDYDADKIRTDIEALYSMGYFDEIDIKKDGSVLTVQVKERPVINEVIFEGNEKVSTSDLEDVIKVKKWNILDINKVQQDVDLIQKHYEEKGYYLAKVTYEVREDKTVSKDAAEKGQEVKLVYKIADYDKVEIKQIAFLNNKAFSDAKLKSIFAETKEGDSVSFLSSSGTFKEASFKIDLQRLQYWYLEHGYLKFRFENPIITISDDKKYVYISIYVEEGDPYTVGGYDFSGDLLFPKDELKKEVKMLEGQTFSISARNADILRLTEKYQDLGYAFVNVVPKMDFNEENKTVSMDYSFEKGNLVYFGEIRILGNSKTYDKVIRRELRIYEGELFSGSKLRISKERVERLGYFAPGEVQFNQVPRKGRDDLLDIEIQVKERSTGSVTVGAGYSSVQGFFFQGKVQEINLLGRGQSLSLETQWGKEDTVRSFSLDFMDPYAFDTEWSAGFSLFMSNSPIPDRYLVRRSGFNLKLGHPLSDDVNAYITYKFEHLRVLRNYANDRNDQNWTLTHDADPINDNLVLPALSADEDLDKGILSSIVLSVVRDKRNNRFETSDGNYQNASLEFAGLGGVKNFSKFTFNNRYYNNFIGSFVFKNSTEIGAMINTGGRGIPPAEKFYLGGPWNMRGYEAFSLAPVIMRANGSLEKIGGASELYSLFELEHPLIKEAGIKWVFFYDIGNAFETVTISEMRQNWGFGIRWFSPLGPLRFEWGFPIGRRLNATEGALEESPTFIFFIGQPF